MARSVMVKVIDGKENTIDETIVTYPIDIPSDVLFYTRDGILYASFWDLRHNLIEVPTTNLVSID